MANNRQWIFDPYKDWILEHLSEYQRYSDLLNDLEKNFGIKGTRNGIKTWFYRKCNISNPLGRNEFTDSEKDFIRRFYPAHGPSQTTEAINDIYQTNRSISGVQQMAQKLGVKCDYEVMCNNHKIGGKASGDKIRRDLGSVRTEIDQRGKVFYRMKTERGWLTAGRAVWEQHHGPMPEGYKIIYLDGDPGNYQIENLYLADAKTQYQVVNNVHYKSHEPEITKTLIKYYELRNALGVDCWEWQRISRKFNYIMEDLECTNSVTKLQ